MAKVTNAVIPVDVGSEVKEEVTNMVSEVVSSEVVSEVVSSEVAAAAAIVAQADYDNAAAELAATVAAAAAAAAIIANRTAHKRSDVLAAMDREEIENEEIARLRPIVAEKKSSYEVAAIAAIAPLETALHNLIAANTAARIVALSPDTTDRGEAVNAAAGAYRNLLVMQFTVDTARRAAGLEVKTRTAPRTANTAAAGEGGTVRRAGGILYRTSNNELHHKVYAPAFALLSPIFDKAGVTVRGANHPVIYGGEPGGRHLNIAANDVPKVAAEIVKAGETAGKGNALQIMLDRCNRFMAGEAGDTIKVK